MKLSVKSMALTLGILWGAVFLLVGLANQIWNGYGLPFLVLMDSIYPGYDVGGFGSVIVGTVYAFVDAAVGGAVLAWLYNRLIG